MEGDHWCGRDVDNDANQTPLGGGSKGMKIGQKEHETVMSS